MPSLPPQPAISYRAEVQRKALHLLALVVPAGMAVLGRTGSLLLLVPLALVAVVGDVLRVRSAAFARFIDRLFGFLMRPEERPAVGGPIVLNGATWVLVTAALLAFTFPLHIGVAAFAVFMVSDAAAALLGRRYGRLRWMGGQRTVEGSLAFLATGMLIMWGLLQIPVDQLGFVQLPLQRTVPLWVAALCVAAGAIAEAVPRPLNDNVRAPFVMALLLFLLERYVLGYTDLTLFGW